MNEFTQPVGYQDLACKADSIYELALEMAGHATDTTGQVKAYDLALKAVRLHAELREKHQRPAQIESLRQDLERVERTIKAHHAGIDDRARETADPEGEPPPWRQ